MLPFHRIWIALDSLGIGVHARSFVAIVPPQEITT